MIEYRDIICTAVHRAAACPSGSSLRAQRGAESGPVSVCVRAGMASPFDVDAWLGADLGRWSLPTRLAEFLKASWTKKEWTAVDVPKDEGKATKAEQGLFADLLDDAAKAKGEVVGKADHRRLANFLCAPDEASSKDEEAKKTYVPSKQCQADMAAQGATNYRDLVFSELSLVAGRPASADELEGGVYSGPASLTVGGKLLIKSKEKTFDAELELAIAEGRTGRIDSWVTRLAGLCQDSDYPFAPIFASNLLKFLMKAKQNLKQDSLVLAYMREHRGDKVGRGFPLAYDSELADRAKAAVVDHQMPTRGDESTAMSAQLAEIASAVRTVSSKVGSFEASLQSVKTNLKALENKVASGESSKMGGRNCLICDLPGHKFEDCPDKPDGYEPPKWYKDFAERKRGGK